MFCSGESGILLARVLTTALSLAFARRTDVVGYVTERPYDPGVIVLILIIGALGLSLVALAAGRYASWFGVVVPVAMVLVLGVGWEWDPDAIPFVIASAVLGGLGFAVGLSSRRKRRTVFG